MNTMTTTPDWYEFPSSDALAEALADTVTAALAAAIDRRGQAVLAVSGGNTPGRFFQALSQRTLDWGKVTVTLVDERFVPETSSRSNAALVRRLLLANKAASARLMPLYRQTASVAAAAQQASADLAHLPAPLLDVAILGMGTDGHTASFFPDADNLAALLDPESSALILPVHAPSAGEERLTLTLARLLEAGLLALHIEGDDKKAVLEAPLRPGGTKPVSAVFAHASRPVPVYWTK